MRADYHQARAAVALEASVVPVEETFSSLCPVCNGGTTGELKLRVTRTHNGAVFVCLRSSCGWRGFVALDDSGVSRDQLPQRKPKPTRPYEGELLYDVERNYRLFQAYKGFSRNTVAENFKRWGLYYDTAGNVVYECRDFAARLRGHVTRDAKKVIRTFRAVPDAPLFAVYRGSLTLSLPWVLVEDCISAMCCASWGYNAVSLLGTNVPAEVIEYLRGERVAIYLDADAQRVAVAYAQAHDWSVILQESDPKDNPRLGYLLQAHFA